MKRHLIVATLGALVLLEGLVFGTLISTARTGSSSKMIEHAGLIGGSIKFEVAAPNEAYPNEPSYVTIKVYQLVPDPVYIEFITARVRYSWTLEEPLVRYKNLTGNETKQWSVNKTFHLSGMHVPKTTWVGNHIFFDLDFSLYYPSLNYTARNLLTFSLGLVTEKTGGAGYSLNIQILIYALVSTTVLFMATTIYFARKTRVKPGRKTTCHPLFYLRLVFSKILSVLFHFLGLVLSFDPPASWTEADRSMASS